MPAEAGRAFVAAALRAEKAARLQEEAALYEQAAQAFADAGLGEERFGALVGRVRSLNGAEFDELALQEELDQVISGRDLPDLDAYLALQRVGRGSALPARARTAVWEAYEEFARRMERKRLTFFPELRRDAVRVLREGRVQRGGGGGRDRVGGAWHFATVGGVAAIGDECGEFIGLAGNGDGARDDPRDDLGRKV